MPKVEGPWGRGRLSFSVPAERTCSTSYEHFDGFHKYADSSESIPLTRAW
jgi:hypothetical protein